MLFQQDSQTILVRAAKVLGHLARAGGSLTADFVVFEVLRALEWLQSERFQGNRLAAVLVLKELAENAPTLFYAHVATFFQNISVALCDKNKNIRESATLALAAALNLVAGRESRQRVQWYYQIYATATKAFGKGYVHIIHGGLSSSADSSKDPKISVQDLKRSAILSALQQTPRWSDQEYSDRASTSLAAFAPEIFIAKYLDTTMKHLTYSLTRQSRKATAFIAIGKLALAVKEHIEPHIESIMAHVRDCLTGKSKKGAQEALHCLSDLAKATSAGVKTTSGGGGTFAASQNVLVSRRSRCWI